MVANVAGIYGKPPADVVETPRDAIQFSPLMPGASELVSQADGSLASMTILAPPGTLERRYTLALALRAVAPGSTVVALAPKDQGGTRLRKELQAFGCMTEETARRHHRIVTCKRPDRLTAIDEALAAGGPQLLPDFGLWSQPGVFSWDRIDPGSALLLQHLPALSGRGADFGCGVGVLARAVLASPKVAQLTLVDIDRRAVQAAQRNLDDARLSFRWIDVRDPNPDLAALDFVVMNAPFHDAGTEDRGLALNFVKRAAEALRPGGVCWLTANRHLPYEGAMKPLFKRVDLTIETGGYKIYEAHK
ncbi:MAG: rRNA (guanine1207-N2)-methyltransferase [Mycobacterium sp.]|nr:rRNA (guanine1207-N2)-methyltransferase [Mycobacterium sp.]